MEHAGQIRSGSCGHNAGAQPPHAFAALLEGSVTGRGTETGSRDGSSAGGRDEVCQWQAGLETQSQLQSTGREAGREAGSLLAGTVPDWKAGQPAAGKDKGQVGGRSGCRYFT